jgi:hypothetical protein
MPLFDRYGRTIYQQYFTLNDTPPQAEETQQPEEIQQGGSAKKGSKRLQKFSNLKISSLDDKPKQKLTKFINLQL